MSKSHCAECIGLLNSSDRRLGRSCSASSFYPNIGFANVMAYNDADGSCTVSLAELATVCSAHFAECVSFLDDSSEPTSVPTCEQVYLGEDIGCASVMDYYDDDQRCHISMVELASVC